MIIPIPEALREKLGPEGARALAELLNEASVQTRGDVIEIAAGRFERRLAEEAGKLRAEMHTGFGELRAEMEAKMASYHGKLIGWMFAFWIGQVFALLGILFAFFRT